MKNAEAPVECSRRRIEPVDASPLVQRRFHRPRHGLLVGDIAFDCHGPLHTNLVGDLMRRFEVSVDDGKLGARAAMIRALAALRDTVGDLQRIDKILRLNVYVNSTEDFSQQSAVADGASALIYELFGPEQGRHARTSVGVAQLPRNAAVELDIVVALES